MSTLHFSRAVTETIRTVPIDDYFEDLADGSLDPLSILLADEFEADMEYEYYQPDIQEHQQMGNIQINEEDTVVKTTIINKTEEAIMSTTTLNNKAFDVKAFLKIANAIDANEDGPDQHGRNKVVKVATPEWLVVKNGFACTVANAFWVTAGIVKATRGILDALTYTQRQLDEAIERLTVQELRAGRTTTENLNFGPAMTKVGIDLAFKGAAMVDVYEDDEDAYDDEDHGYKGKVSGFNPDGMEYDLALEEAAAEVDKLEAVVANGERIIGDIVTWIDTYAVDLQLVVETGHKVTLGPIGNEIRRAIRTTLTWETLLVGIQLQREFIRNNPRK